MINRVGSQHGVQELASITNLNPVHRRRALQWRSRVTTSSAAGRRWESEWFYIFYRNLYFVWLFRGAVDCT
jgi:hypothetical protein